MFSYWLPSLPLVQQKTKEKGEKKLQTIYVVDERRPDKRGAKEKNPKNNLITSWHKLKMVSEKAKVFVSLSDSGRDKRQAKFQPKQEICFLYAPSWYVI